MAFKKGKSGNPKGRPAGGVDKRRELKNLLEPHTPALIEKAVALALAGDTAALKMCLDRIIPPMRSIEFDTVSGQQPVKFVLNMGKPLKPAQKEKV